VGGQFYPDTVEFLDGLALGRVNFKTTVGDSDFVNGKGSAVQLLPGPEY
jgi:hypothetical protein